MVLRHARALLAALAVLGAGATFLAIACTSEVTGTGSPGDAGPGSTPGTSSSSTGGPSTTSSADGATSSGGCNDLPDRGGNVLVQVFPGEPPIPAGGTIVDGVYALSEAALFTSSGGQASGKQVFVKGTISVRGKTVQSVATVVGAETVRRTSTYTTQGTTLTLTDSCPVPTSANDEYSASPSEIHLFESAEQGTLVEVYTRTGP